MIDPTSIPHGIQRAERCAETCKMSPARMVELADAGMIPHYRIDGVPYFQPQEARKWIAEHLLTRVDGAKSLTVNVVAPAPPASSPVPPALKDIPDLRELPVIQFTPGVYFLCKGDEVVYVGQSANPLARCAAHEGDGKEFDYVFLLPCPRSELDCVESTFIHALRPRLNGQLRNGDMCAPLRAVTLDAA